MATLWLAADKPQTPTPKTVARCDMKCRAEAQVVPGWVLEHSALRPRRRSVSFPNSLCNTGQTHSALGGGSRSVRKCAALRPGLAGKPIFDGATVCAAACRGESTIVEGVGPPRGNTTTHAHHSYSVCPRLIGGERTPYGLYCTFTQRHSSQKPVENGAFRVFGPARSRRCHLRTLLARRCLRSLENSLNKRYRQLIVCNVSSTNI